MGKLKRRQKLHISSNKGEKRQIDNFDPGDTTSVLPLTSPKDDLFSGLIDFGNIKNNLSDDTQSVKSYKSVKSNVSGQKILPKKDKIKLRRKLLLQKIDSVNQLKKELKLRRKRENNAVIGDTNPLHDALPSLESLLKSRPSIQYTIPTQTFLNKGIIKANKRKKKFVQDVNMYKQTLKSPNFKKNPFEAISDHIRKVVDHERSLIAYNKK